MNTKSTVVVTVGRNVGDTPMPPNMWKMAIIALYEAVRVARGQVVFQGQGDGVWENVIREDAYAIIAIIPDRFIPVCRGRLATIARDFNQEACGMVVHDEGTDSLVRARQ